MFEDAEDHIATGSESLAEFANNAGMDRPDCCWLLDSRDVWVRNPHYTGPDQPHPEDYQPEPVQSNSYAERMGKPEPRQESEPDEDYERYYENKYDQDFRE